jgi:hypothetical protein
MIPEDRVEILRVLDEEMGGDVHRIGTKGEEADDSILPSNLSR